MSLKLNNTEIEVRPNNGFINATQLCKAGGKKFQDWSRLESTKSLIASLKTNTNISLYDNLIDSKVGRYSQGSWVHPRLATALALWIDPMFYVHVSLWIEEWKEYDTRNQTRFIEKLSTITPSEIDQREKTIQRELAFRFNGEIEVETPVGYIDILTQTQVIEIKEARNWKSAIGQVICYGDYYPSHSKVIYLFGELNVDEKVIRDLCRKNKIDLVALI